MSRQEAVTEVSKEIKSKYFHDTVFSKPFRSIFRSVETLYENFMGGKKEAKRGRMNLAKAKACVDMIKDKNKLFDMSTEVVGGRVGGKNGRNGAGLP